MSVRTTIALLLPAVALLGASPAAAHVIAQSDLRSPVPLGATDRLGSVTVINEDPQPEDPSDPGPPPFTVCNLGECGSSQGITLVPACAAQAADGACTALDEGVFAISSTGVGATSGCAGTQFTITELSPGRFSFNPATPGEHIVLAPQFRCRIDFTYDVVRAPTTDAMPAVDGLQATQVTEVFSAQDLQTATPAFDRGSDSVTFIAPPPAPARPAPSARPPPRPPVLDTTRPVLSALSLSRSRFRPAAARRAIAAVAAAGTRVRYRLSEAAAVHFRIERIRRGRRYVALRRGFTDDGREGANSFRFRGRLRGRTLAPGLYRISAVASDAAGNSSTPVRTRFRILPR